MAIIREIPANYLFMNRQTHGDVFGTGGSPVNVITPEYIGQMYMDLTNTDWYISVGPEIDDWKKLTP